MSRKSPELPKTDQPKAVKEGRPSYNISIASTEVQNHRPEAAILNVPAIPSCRTHVIKQRRKSLKRKAPHQQPGDDSLEYHKIILTGAKSLGVELCPQLQRDIGDRRGKVYVPGTLSHRSITTSKEENFSGFGGGLVDATYDAKIEVQFLFQDGAAWGDDLAGTGHQFALSSVGLSASR